MKKLILMTSALTLVGGSAFAAAHGGGEIAISAEASVAYGNWDIAQGAAAVMSYDASATMTLTGSAGDVSYGGSVTVEAVDTVSLGEIYVSTAYGRFAFDMDTYNADVADSEGGDIEYTGEFGGVSVEAVVDADTQAWFVGASTTLSGVTVAGGVDSTNAWEVSAEATVGGVTIGASTDDANAWEVTAATTVSGIDISGSYDSASAWDVTVGATTGAVTWSATYESSGEYAASASTTFGATTVSAEYDSDANYDDGGTYDSDDAIWLVSVEHVVGGLTLHAMVNERTEYELGATAAFTF